MVLIVQIPVLNEEKTLESLVLQTLQTLRPHPGNLHFGILLIDDGSTDRSWEKIQRLERAHPEVHGVRHEQRQGLGRVFRLGVAYAKEKKADILVNMDGDAQFRPEDIPALIHPILRGDAEVTLTTRFARNVAPPQMPWAKHWGNRVFAGLLSTMTGRALSDVSCGFRAFSSDALLHLTPHNRFTYTHESILQCHAAGMRIVELSLPVKGEREFGRSRMANNLFRYGVLAISGIIAAQWRILWRYPSIDHPKNPAPHPQEPRN